MNAALPVDLRSDTVTRPSTAMRRAIADAEVGDDVLDGDPTTRTLEARVAQVLGHEAALFFPTGTQANQVAMNLHAERGTEVIVDAGAHLLHYEQSATAALWGVQLREVDTADGILTPELVRPKVREGSADYPRTAAIAVENTHSAAGGRVTDLATLAGLRELAEAVGVSLHIDGARLWNAAVALGEPPARLARYGHTVMVSFSKGLGCPAGSCLAGPTGLMERGVPVRRGLGGGMRQSGMLAAACLYALDHNLERIAEDHAHARLLAGALEASTTMTVIQPDSNIVMMDLSSGSARDAAHSLSQAGVQLSVYGPRRLRAVTHLDVTEADVRRAAEVILDVQG